MMETEPHSTEFSDPRLTAAYDALNALGEDSDFWLALVARLSPKSIIDLGCGTGLLTCELARRGYEMIGVEPAARMIEVARKKPDAEKVKWIEGGFDMLEGLSADMVLMTSHVAQFFLEENEWRAMLSVAFRTLPPGGHLVFDSRTPIFPPFQTWPTEASPRRGADPIVGPIEWWHKLLEIKDNRVRYQLYYHFINTDETIVSTDELIFRSRDKLTESLEQTGFKIEAVYGDWDGSFATATSPEMIFVAKL